MADATQKLPTRLSSSAKFSILLVSPYSEDEDVLCRMTASADASIERCVTVADAMQRLEKNTPDVVMCECNLPDGDWKTLLEYCNPVRNEPLFVVTSKHADESLWAEVLNLGGYDLLLKPFDRAEVTRVLGLNWRPARETVARPPATAMAVSPARFA